MESLGFRSSAWPARAGLVPRGLCPRHKVLSVWCSLSWELPQGPSTPLLLSLSAAGKVHEAALVWELLAAPCPHSPRVRLPMGTGRQPGPSVQGGTWARSCRLLSQGHPHPLPYPSPRPSGCPLTPSLYTLVLKRAGCKQWNQVLHCRHWLEMKHRPDQPAPGTRGQAEAASLKVFVVSGPCRPAFLSQGAPVPAVPPAPDGTPSARSPDREGGRGTVLSHCAARAR